MVLLAILLGLFPYFGNDAVGRRRLEGTVAGPVQGRIGLAEAYAQWKEAQPDRASHHGARSLPGRGIRAGFWTAEVLAKLDELTAGEN